MKTSTPHRPRPPVRIQPGHEAESAALFNLRYSRLRHRLENHVEKNCARIAIHESAHALYARAYPMGKPFGVKRVEIGLRMNERLGAPCQNYDSFGRFLMKRRPTTRALVHDRVLAEHFLVLALAGPAAEYHSAGRQRWGRCRELDGDHWRLYLLALHGHCCTDGYVNWLRQRAMLFVEATHLTIHALAQVLSEKRELRAADVDAVLAANPSHLVPIAAIKRTYGIDLESPVPPLGTTPQDEGI